MGKQILKCDDSNGEHFVAVSCGVGEIAEHKLVGFVGLRIDDGEEVGEG
jgi:hypothetical protein